MNIVFAVQMTLINNTDVKIIISEACCVYTLRAYTHILVFLLKWFLKSHKISVDALLLFYYLWPLADVWEQFSKSLPKIIVNYLKYFSAHALLVPCFSSVFFFGIIIYVLVLEPPQRNYAVFTFKRSSQRLFHCLLEEEKEKHRKLYPTYGDCRVMSSSLLFTFLNLLFTVSLTFCSLCWW